MDHPAFSLTRLLERQSVTARSGTDDMRAATADSPPVESYLVEFDVIAVLISPGEEKQPALGLRVDVPLIDAVPGVGWPCSRRQPESGSLRASNNCRCSPPNTQGYWGKNGSGVFDRPACSPTTGHARQGV